MVPHVTSDVLCSVPVDTVTEGLVSASARPACLAQRAASHARAGLGAQTASTSATAFKIIPPAVIRR